MGAAALLAASAVAIGLTIWQLRSDALNQARGDAHNIAIVLARQATYSTQSIDLTLGQVVDYYKTLGVGPAECARLRARFTS